MVWCNGRTETDRASSFRSGVKHDGCQDRRRAHRVARGRPHRLYRRRAGADVTDASGLPQCGAVRGRALRFPGAAGKYRADDLPAEGSNRRVNRAWQMPRNYDEMVQRRKALQAWAARPLRLHGPLARSPRLRAGRSAHGHRCVPQAQPRARQGIEDYFDYATKNDMFLTYVIINPQAERGKDWGEQNRRPGRPHRRRGLVAASPSAAPRCWAPARSWRTRCSWPTCSR